MIVAALAAILGVILLHELGHFLVARATGVKVLKFSIGFGKSLWSYRSKKSGTEYVLAVLPLGGYVKMLGEEPDVELTDEQRKQAFSQKPVWARFSIAAAGPVVNFMLAILLFWGIFLHGVTHVRPIIGALTPDSIAAKAGVPVGSQIVRIDSTATPSWQRVMMAMVSRAGETGSMKLVVEKPDGVVSSYRLDLKHWHYDERNPDFIKSLGLVPYMPAFPALINKVVAHSPAAKAGLMPGDKVVALDGVAVNSWVPLVKAIQAKPGDKVALTVMREGQLKTLPLTVGVHKQHGLDVGYIGAAAKPPKWPASLLHKEHFSFFGASGYAIAQAWMLTKLNVVVLGKMLSGKISVSSLGGPITVFQTAGKASQSGWIVYLGFIAFISLTLGFINLLPIPGLDGGHLLFYIVEAIAGRPVPEKYQMIGLRIGMALLILLMLQATYNDVLRLL